MIPLNPETRDPTPGNIPKPLDDEPPQQKIIPKRKAT
jgi:hypothetical protein